MHPALTRSQPPPLLFLYIYMYTAGLVFHIQIHKVTKKIILLPTMHSLLLLGNFRIIGPAFYWFWISFLIQAMVSPSILSSPAILIAGNETDRLSLLEFKSKITYDPFGVMSSWNNTSHFCHWYGVTCSRRHQRVTTLNLSFSKLAGFISPHVGNLSFIRELVLQNNDLAGEIPSEVGRLQKMRRIILANNSFTGNIPSNISYSTDITVIDFSFNKLVGKVPKEFTSLSQLQYFNIRKNKLTGGIPTFFGNFSSLHTLDAYENSLIGSIPEALGHLTNLEYIDLGVNYFSGTIPASLYNISSISTFRLVQNQFQGTLPTDLGINLPNLEYFNVAINQFAGVIPQSISNATNLRHFLAFQNNFIGKVPNLERLRMLQNLVIFANHLGTGEDDLSFVSSMENATSLLKLGLHENKLQGLLPKSIGNLSITIEWLGLHSNELSGPIPTEILKLRNLQMLLLHNNKITGVIPSDIGMLKKLNILYAGENKLSGNIPASIGNLSLLTTLELANNNFQGHIPSSIGNCHNLVRLNLSYNNLTGTIPKQVLSLSSLSIILDLSNNHLTGSLPIEVEKLINLGELIVSHNLLSGEIPSSLGSCVMLESLQMESNFIQGNIPSTLRSLRGLKYLDLSQNNLTGQIPMFLKDFNSLEYLNLSFNNLEGMVPVEGVFKNANSTSVLGNKKLCGGIPEFHLPMCTSERRLTLTSKLMIILFGFLGVTLVLCCLYFWLVRRKKVLPASTLNLLGGLQMSYQSLLTATDGLSSDNLIGKGSFGSVYKGTLDQGGTIIAVKVLNLLRQGASKSFMAECKTWRNIRHRNLVKVLTVCSGVDYHGNDFKALVYEFMANGNLEDWLHPSHTMDEAPKALDFFQRINVAIEVACALDYLHHHCETPIVHCDLKPSNVLLDHDMTAHVGDFGLARFLLESNHVTSQTSSIGVRGTIGYAAPEYGMGSEVSTSGDVYSYGILLLELFIGKRPVDDMFKDGLNLHIFARDALPKRVAEIVDPFLLQEAFHRETPRGHRFQECLISVLEIGVACSVEFPQDRMNMSDVTAKLQSIRRKLH